MIRRTTFPTRLHVCPAKTYQPIIRAVVSESSYGTLRVSKNPKCVQVDNEDSDLSSQGAHAVL